MNPHALRAQQLISQGRWSQAAEELRHALASDPGDAQVLALLAICESAAEHPKEALAAAQAALAADADLPLAHQAHAHALLADHRPADAEAAARAAVTRDPGDPAMHALLSSCLLARSRYAEALAACEAGLAIDPEHGACNDLRGRCLVQLGRKDEAGVHVDLHLQRNPDDADAHANRGFDRLHRNDPRAAAEHFAEALRLDPDHQFAKAGLAEALKARYWPYRIILGFFLWLSRLSPGLRIGVILGGYLLYRVLLDVSDRHPALAPWLAPVIWAYFTFALATWAITPLFDLVLLSHPRGRYALSPRQRTAALACGALIAIAFGAVLAYFLNRSTFTLLVALLSGMLIPPLHTALTASSPRHRLALLGACALVAGLGLTALTLLHGGDRDGMRFWNWTFYAWFAVQFLPGLLRSRGR